MVGKKPPDLGARDSARAESGTGSTRPDQVTALLARYRAGDLTARDALIQVVYDELRGMAQARLAAERPGHSFQPSDLVQEACQRLLRAPMEFQGRAHLFGAAARAMMQVLVNHARDKQADKRRAPGVRVSLHSGVELEEAEESIDVQHLSQALSTLERGSPELAEIVFLHGIAGLTFKQVGEALGIGPLTAKLKYARAKTELARLMGSNGG